MKALTIYQPWASLIMAGAKPYEFRKWSPRERGGSYAAMIGERIVIHASTRRIKPSEIGFILDKRREGGDAWTGTCLHQDKAEPILEAAYAMSLCNDDGSGTWLRYGVGLGTVILGEPRNGIDVAEAEFGLSVEAQHPLIGKEGFEGFEGFDSDRRKHANFAWPMLDVEEWDQPIPMRGLQGFWNWPTAAESGL